MKYSKTTKRKDLKLDIDVARESIVGGLLGAGILLSCGAIYVSSYLSGETKIDGFVSLLGDLFAALIVIVWSGLCLIVVMSGISTLFKRRKWFKGAISDHAIITGRGSACSEDQYGEITSCRYEFALRIGLLPIKDDYSEQVISVSVSKHIYNRYARSDTIRVYYSVTDPLEILIKGE